jgi:hypothetical protein
VIEPDGHPTLRHAVNSAVGARVSDPAPTRLSLGARL